MSDKMMDLIQKLLNQAAGAGTDAERATFQAKADQLMFQHKIDEAMLRIRNADVRAAEKPRTVPTDEKFLWVSRGDEFYDSHVRMAGALSQLCDVRIVFYGYDHIHVIGYPQDIAYFRMLWVSCNLTFSGKLFPKWNKSATAAENIRAFVESGYKWDGVWREAVSAGQPLTHPKTGEPIPCPPKDNGWMKRQLTAAYKATGEERPKLTHTVRNYRQSYAEGFTRDYVLRCARMVLDRRAAATSAGDGVSLVLKTDADAVLDYFNSLYPPGSLGLAQPTRKSFGMMAGVAARGAAAAQSVDMTGGGSGVSAGRSRGEIG